MVQNESSYVGGPGQVLMCLKMGHSAAGHAEARAESVPHAVVTLVSRDTEPTVWTSG